MVAINSPDDFELWLADKPADWAAAIALRIALRVFPLIAWAYTIYDDAGWRLTHQTWRALTIYPHTRNFRRGDFLRAARRTVLSKAPVTAKAISTIHDALDALAVRASRGTRARSAMRANNTALDAFDAIDPIDPLNTFNFRHPLDALNHLNRDTSGAALFAFDADASWLEEHRDPGGLAARPLWPEGMPERLQDIWQATRPALAAEMPLVADWYDRRLRGAATAFDLPPGADLAVVQRIAAARKELWDRDPRTINDTITGWIDDARAALAPVIPDQQPGELRTFPRDGRVARLIEPPQTDGNDAGLRDAWQALRHALDDMLAEGLSGNQPRFDRMLQRLAHALGASFESANAVGIGVQAQYLDQYALRADELFLADRAADVVGLNIGVSQFIIKLPEWRAYLQGPAPTPLTPQVVQAAEAIITAVQETNIAEPGVIEPLTTMLDDAKDELAPADPESPKLAAYGQRLVSGLGNTLSTAGKLALDCVKKCMASADDGFQSGIKKSAEAATIAFFGSVTAALLIFAGIDPQFAWIAALLGFLKNNTPK